MFFIQESYAMETREIESLVMEAVIHNNKPALEFLLTTDAKPDLNYRNAEGKTPLFLAVFYGRNELAILLLMAGADPNIQNDYGWTPLMQARFQRNYTMINILLEACADPTFKNLKEETIYEMDFGDGPLITPILLNDSNTLNQFLQKIPVSNYQFPIKISIQLKRYACLEILLKQFPNLDDDKYLEKAFLLEDFVSFELLLKAGANPNIPDDSGNSLLHNAVHLKKHLFVNALLLHHADVNALDKFGETPLMIAIKQKDPFSIKALADKKPDLTIKNSDGENVISLIQENNEYPRTSQKSEKSPNIPKKPVKHFSFFNSYPMTLMTGAFCAGMLTYHFIRSRR